MPELPEVHTILEDLRQAGLVNHTIQHAHVYWPKTVNCPSPALFCQLLINKKFQDLQRRGKYLILSLSEQWFLCIHLRMTGRLTLTSAQIPPAPHVRLRLELDQGKALDFHDTRKFGRWYLVQDPQSIVGKIGPEPLDSTFTFTSFWEKLHKRSRALKPLLLDQFFLAGLGNIYVDEALWEAHLHPLTQANHVSKHQAQALHKGIIYVLKRGIQHQGTTLGKGKTNYYRLDGTKGEHQTVLNVFRQTGHPCPRCQHPIERLVVAQRSTHFCPVCQPLV